MNDQQTPYQEEKEEIETKENRIPTRKNETEENKINLNITMNPWGFAFFIFFGGVLGYLLAAVITPLPPFDVNSSSEIIVENDLVLTILLIGMLVFLGLGYYFGCVRKKPEKEKELAVEKQVTDKEDQIIFSKTEEKNETLMDQEE